MPKVLIVSSAFPPLGSVGASIRLVKLLKFLSSQNWRFVVFTQDIQRTVVPEQRLSSVLLDELPADVAIKRIAAPFSPSQPLRKDGLKAILRRNFQRIFGDSSLMWGLRTFWNGLAELHKSRFDLIFGVTPPFTNALIVILLGWMGHKPFVLDLKDDWVGSPTFRHKSVLRQRFEAMLERLIVSNASAIITATPESYRLYTERYQYLGQPQKFHLIPNGCDLDEYENLRNRERKIVSNRFLILSSAWGFRKTYRDINPFLLALDIFFKKHPDAKTKAEVVLLGDSLSAEYGELLTELRLDKIIQQAGAVKRDQLLEWLWKADLFLLVQPVHNTTAISGTLYEYWATGKAPILLISEEGASSLFVENNGIGKHFHFDQVEQIADYIESVYNAYQMRKPVWAERDGIQNFDRKLLARRMAAVWDSIISAKCCL